MLVVVPGSGFGCPNHLRLSFATSEEALQKALDRMAQFIALQPLFNIVLHCAFMHRL